MLAAHQYVSRIQLSNNQTLQESAVVVLPGWKRLVCGFMRMKEQEGPELVGQEGDCAIRESAGGTAIRDLFVPNHDTSTFD